MTSQVSEKVIDIANRGLATNHLGHSVKLCRHCMGAMYRQLREEDAELWKGSLDKHVAEISIGASPVSYVCSDYAMPPISAIRKLSLVSEKVVVEDPITYLLSGWRSFRKEERSEYLIKALFYLKELEELLNARIVELVPHLGYIRGPRRFVEKSTEADLKDAAFVRSFQESTSRKSAKDSLRLEMTHVSMNVNSMIYAMDQFGMVPTAYDLKTWSALTWKLGRLGKEPIAAREDILLNQSVSSIRIPSLEGLSNEDVLKIRVEAGSLIEFRGYFWRGIREIRNATNSNDAAEIMRQLSERVRLDTIQYEKNLQSLRRAYLSKVTKTAIKIGAPVGIALAAIASGGGNYLADYISSLPSVVASAGGGFGIAKVVNNLLDWNVDKRNLKAANTPVAILLDLEKRSRGAATRERDATYRIVRSIQDYAAKNIRLARVSK